MATSTSKRRPTKIDPELGRQLDAAKETNAPVEAVLMLRNSAKPFGDASEKARDALRRVELLLGTSPDVVNILENLGIVIVSATEPFVRELVAQPEFASAVANVDIESSAATKASTTSHASVSKSTARDARPPRH
jgi:hypothetical protein